MLPIEVLPLQCKYETMAKKKLLKTPPNRVTTSFRIEHIKPLLEKKSKGKVHKYVVALLEKDVNYKSK